MPDEDMPPAAPTPPEATAASRAKLETRNSKLETPPGGEGKKPGYTYRGEGTGLFQRCAWNMGRFLSRIVSILLFRLKVRGQERIPKTGGVLLVANHQSFLDPWLLGIAPKRQVHYMARDTLFKGGFLHWLMELLNTFPVKRGAADFAAIRMAVDVLDKGYVLTVFPEGTRSEDGSIGTLAPGISLILNRCKTEPCIVPACIDGAYEAWPRDRKRPKFTGNHVRILHGQPISPSEWKSLDANELAFRIRQDLVNLQKEMGSPHSAESQRRLDDEKTIATAKPKRRRP